MKKHIFLISIITMLFSILGKAQELTTLRITDWNSLKKSGFYECLTSDTKNAPSSHGWYWGINIGHTTNSSTTGLYSYNAQIAIGVNPDPIGIPVMYVRSTNIAGEGIWAKVVHSKGNHAIDGTLTVKEIVVKTVTGADFVFNEGYNLIPLSEVETFVKENKHLPEIPSEKQMVKDGVNVTDLQIKLLQKIEELTLYTIQQQKQLEEQGSMIRELQSTINNNPK